MQRRRFLTCTAVTSATTLTAWMASIARAVAADATQMHARSLLVDADGAPLKAASLAPNTNYVFNYPFASTPCFLLDLARPVAPASHLTQADGRTYDWQGGVGPGHSIVAFSAICAHKLAYPTRELSFIRFQPSRSPTADGGTIHCCAEHSIYDPAAGARVVGGPAPQPLAAIVLEYDAPTDALTATGTVGAEQFDAFFRKYDFKLAMDYGKNKARESVGSTVVVREMTQYCRQTIEC